MPINDPNSAVALNRQLHFEGTNESRTVLPYIDGYGLVFFTRPKLFLYPENNTSEKTAISSDLKNLQYYANLNMEHDGVFVPFLDRTSPNDNDKRTIRSLSYFYGPDKNSDTDPFRTDIRNFIPLLTNAAMGFTPKDVVLNTMDMYATRDGYNFRLPTSVVQSISADSIDINFNETDNMDVSKLLSLWTLYIYNISKGNFTANPEMIKSAILDYATSMYYIALKPDFKTISYYAKYTGVFPVVAPYSNFKFSKLNHDVSEIAASFSYSKKEDMNIRILEDFNRVSLNHNMTVAKQTEDDIFLYTKMTPTTDGNQDTTAKAATQYDANSMRIFDIDIINSKYHDILPEIPYVYAQKGVDGSPDILKLELPYQDPSLIKNIKTFPTPMFNDQVKETHNVMGGADSSENQYVPYYTGQWPIAHQNVVSPKENKESGGEV